VVYVFERSGNAWTQAAELVADDGGPGDAFGISVAADGNNIFVGASSHDHVPSTNQGSAYAFERQGSNWVQAQELLPMDPFYNMSFANYLAADSGTLVVSGENDNDAGFNTGAAYAFRQAPGGTWRQIAKILAPDAKPYTLLGSDVAVCGSRTLLGAWGDQTFGFNSGAAYLFDLAPDAVQYCSCPTQGPCGNNDDHGGCKSSTGNGAVLAASGSASVATDDLLLEARWLPANRVGLFFMGGGSNSVPFGDGQLCVSGGGLGVFRFKPPQSSGSQGVLTLGPGVAGLSNSMPAAGHITAGQTWHFQTWFRDQGGPCGSGANLSNAVRVVFGP